MSADTSHTSGSVLVLGGGTRAFLAVIRSLGRAGLTVHVGMCPPDDLALRSRYVARHHPLPPYEVGSPRWEQAVAQLLRAHRFDLVIPCTDSSLIPLQRHQETLSRLGRLYTLSDDAYRIAFDKIASSNLAESLGIPVPKQKSIRTDGPPDAALEGLTLPVVIKPPTSFTAEQLQAKRRVLKARTPEQLRNVLEVAHPWGAALIQEHFDGIGTGVELLAAGGNVLVAFQHVRVHEPPEGGGSSYRKSVPLDPAMLAASRRLMSALAYTGVAMVEFKWCLRTHEWVFIEINGRFWGSLPLSVAAGADFPLYLYQMLVHGVRQFPTDYRCGLYCRNLRLDVEWLRANLAADHRDPTLTTRPLWRVVIECGNVLAGREISDTLQADDQAPGREEIVGLARGLVRRITGALRRRGLRWTPIRWVLARRALAATRRARRILFVCKGNICRSPFAEHYTRQQFGDRIAVNSAGYYPHGDRQPPAAAVEAARRFGVDLGAHRSRIVGGAAVREAEVIFVFDEENRERLLRDWPSARRKVLLLATVLRSGPQEIIDPYGQTEAVFAKTYSVIAEALDALLGNVPR